MPRADMVKTGGRTRLTRHFPPAKVGRWAVVGVLFMGINLPLLYLLVDGCRLPVPVATLVSAMTGTLLRFLANDRFVFGHRRPTWTRLRAYYAAIAAGVAIWYVVVNSLVWFGVYYLLAAVAGTACSFGFSLAANFLWVWPKSGRPVAQDP